jgi:1-acyl-sn-glycerol-3-phosphate acyltransferase
MMNREAFDEGLGIAGWWLQRLGCFSVERGGDTTQAKRYAIDVIERGRDVLVVFPEGEIYYLNDIVQAFKTGAVDIAMQSILESRQAQTDRSVYAVPMAIKYHYRQSVRAVLEARVRRMEARLSRHVRTHALKERIGLILAEVLHRKEIVHKLKAGSARLSDLSNRVLDVQRSVLQEMETKYADAVVNRKTETMDRSWRVSSHVRRLLTQARLFTVEALARLRSDLAEMKGVADMESWQPEYLNVDPSEERLAEMVLKLEREIYGTKRPHQLATRDVFVRLGKPVDLAGFLPEYLQDASSIRRLVTEQLRETIQSMIDGIETEVRVCPSNQRSLYT